MATRVYGVMGSEGTWYYATKEEAVRAAREEKKAGDPYVSVGVNEVATAKEVDGLRALYCALLNGEGWCARWHEVEF